MLPLNLMPEISYPKLTVRAEYSGAAPAEVENDVARPLELLGRHVARRAEHLLCPRQARELGVTRRLVELWREDRGRVLLATVNAWRDELDSA